MANEKKEEMSLATRFSTAVTKAYADVAKGVVVTEYQNKLISNYFIEIDKALKNSKQGYTWKQIKMDELSMSVAHLSKLGIDMSLPNSVSFIPFRDGKTGMVNMVPCIGKGGYEFISRKYGIDPPKHSTVELVFSNDEFVAYKKDATHVGDSYEFKIKSPFNRGKCVGGFGFLQYDDPSKNKLIIMSIDEIMQHKPPNADSTFWGGKNLNAMLEKTIAKKTFKSVTLDPDKINGVHDSFDYVESQEIVGASLEAKEEIAEKNGEGNYIDFDAIEATDVEYTAVVENPVETVENTETDETYSLFGEEREDWHEGDLK